MQNIQSVLSFTSRGLSLSALYGGCGHVVGSRRSSQVGLKFIWESGCSWQSDNLHQGWRLSWFNPYRRLPRDVAVDLRAENNLVGWWISWATPALGHSDRCSYWQGTGWDFIWGRSEGFPDGVFQAGWHPWKFVMPVELLKPGQYSRGKLSILQFKLFQESCRRISE